MNNTLIKTDFDCKSAFITDERKRQIRAVVDNGKIYYCATDIATCFGYLAPHKIVARYPNKNKIKLQVPWVSNKRRGYTASYCLDKEQVARFVERIGVGEDEICRWIFEDVIPRAEATLSLQQKQVEVLSDDANKHLGNDCSGGNEESKENVLPFPVAMNNYQASTLALIERLDQIILDAALLKQELNKAF